MILIHGYYRRMVGLCDDLAFTLSVIGVVSPERSSSGSVPGISRRFNKKNFLDI